MSLWTLYRKIQLFIFASRFRYIALFFVCVFLLQLVSFGDYNETTGYPHIAIALKTGKDVALQRTPIQYLTLLSKLSNIILIGEAPNVMVGNHSMMDVYTDLYKSKQERDMTEQIPDESTVGWKSDAHKNIPGFVVLYNRYPNAEWFMMIDDDTYVMMENLAWFVKQYDSNKPYLFGSATSFVGCDGKTHMDSKPYFAHGGSGILVSRGAMLKFLEIKDECIWKYKDCWAGDIRFSLCLRDAGIYITNSPRFNGVPPNDNLNYLDPCHRPITFHHLDSFHIQTLYNLEKRGTRMLQEIAQTFLSDKIQMNVTKLGKAFKTIQGVTVNECQKICTKNSKCLSFTHSENGCNLKERIKHSKKAIGVSSGVVIKNYKCTAWGRYFNT